MEYDNNSNTVTYKKANGFGNRTFTIFLFLLALFFGIVSIFVGTRNGAYNANDLRDYSEKQYSEIYDKKSNYSEYSNVLVTFITYPNEKDYDLLIKRDKEPGLFYSYDFKEGSYSTFKSYLENTIPESNGYGSRLLVYFTNAIRHLTDTYQKNKYSSDNRYGNPSKSVFVTNFSYEPA